MAEIEKRPASAGSGAGTEVKKDPFKYVPDVIDEFNRDGSAVVNRYKKGLILGKGGFAQVYLSQQSPSNQKVALKIVAKCSLQKARAKQKLQTEIRIHRNLDQENIVRFLRFFEDNNFAYLVLELCSNNSMAELIPNRKRITEPEVRYYLSQLVHSLQYLHHKLVIHRDLKLGNIFLDANMKVKVGDFGLAAKLENENEKRMTVCGTPNYIAPELLEGKKGHSFEVDIWSSGVIMYTLLIGKPPFQSKDVKSTYKRIVANQYSYPDDIFVSQDAKDLIALMLQHKPENRPKLQEILDHVFFTAPGAFTPTSLPDTALKTTPVFTLPAMVGSHKEEPVGKMSAKASAPIYGDENDPNAINRLPLREKNTAALALDTQALKKKADGSVPPPDSARSTGTAGSLPSTFSNYSRSTTASSATVDHATSSRTVATARMRSATTTTTRATSSSSTTTTNLLQTRTALATKETTHAEHGKYEDLHGRTKSSTTSAKSTSTVVPKFDIYTDSRKDVKSYKDEDMMTMKQAPSSSSLHTSESTVGSIQQGIQQIALNENYNNNAYAGNKKSMAVGPETEGVIGMTETRDERWSNSTEKIQPKAKRAKEAWITSTSTATEKPYSQVLPSSSGVLNGAQGKASHHELYMDNLAQPSTTSHTTMATQDTHTFTAATVMQPMTTPTPASQSEPMCMGTPPEQVKPVDYAQEAAIGTLEKMHEMLNENSFSFIENNARLAPVSASATANPKNPFSKVWVVRYVDYTSKYGLGFLFNTGSAGVYFNDSTKIVLSPDGKVFQYIERKRRESSSTIMNDHCSQRHRIDNYPPELQKKVTLLKHFRDYLINQERTGAGNEGDHGFGGNGVEDCGGFSKQAVLSRMDQHCSMEDDSSMPFLKKWIRTKHAILFRLSNRTVQVVFYDKSEVLLSSEARQITYVNKTGERSEHILDDVMVSGRADIAKRLKYTKDIMHRLINSK